MIGEKLKLVQLFALSLVYYNSLKFAYQEKALIHNKRMDYYPVPISFF